MPSMRVVRVQAQPNVSKFVVCALFLEFVFLSRVPLIKMVWLSFKLFVWRIKIVPFITEY